MNFLDSIVRLFRGGSGSRSAPASRPRKQTKKQRQAEMRAARRKVTSSLTNRRTITFVDEDGRREKQVVAKKNGEWNYSYDRDWFPVRGLPAGSLKSALAAKGVA